MHNDWKDKADFIGVDYYRRIHVYKSRIVSLSSAKFLGGAPISDLETNNNQPHGILNDLGWEIYHISANLQSDLLFLVTNRHVVRDRNYLPNVITITLHSDENDMTQNKEYLIHLYDKITPIWRSPDHPEADVVAIPIDRKDFASLDIKYISFASNNLLPKDLQLDVGEDVFIMGYPLGIYDEVHNLPVIRGGTISSAYPILWNRRPYFLVDSNLEEGTSGKSSVDKI